MSVRTERLRHAVTRHPQVTDAVLALALVAAMLVALQHGDAREDVDRGLTVTDFSAALVGFLLITVRRRWPLAAFALSAAATAGFGIWVDLLPQILVAAVVCAYTLASLTNRRTAWIGGAAAAAGIYAAAVLPRGHGWTEAENITVFAWLGMAVAVGDLTRTRRAYIASVLDRAQRAERTREEEARRRVMEERVRIARELHDVVAHHIAMINVQAGVADHLLYQRPEQTKKSLAEIRQAARAVIDELATVLGVLRGTDDEPAEPPPGLERLAQLLDSLADAGLRVEHRQDGDIRPLPAAVDLAAYRIVQESLTNAHKHGAGGRVQLQFEYTSDGLAITVDNRAASGGAGAGYGLTGMRERVAAVGGTLAAGLDEREHFTVSAFLPAPAAAEARR
jgi:signal transduction histidine kinase